MNLQKILLNSIIYVIILLISVCMPVHSLFAETVNLVPNPSFIKNPADTAIPVPLNWYFSTNGINIASSTYPALGPNASTTALGINVSSYTSGATVWFGGFATVTPLAQYQYNESFVATAPGFIEAEFTTAEGINVYVNIGETFSSGGVWTTASTTFIAVPGATSVRVYHVLNNVGSLIIANPSLIYTADPAPFSEALVSLTFDDGNQTDYDYALSILKAAGIPSTHYVVTNAMLNAEIMGTSTSIDSSNNYMTREEVLALNRIGGEISNHTATHCNLATNLCPDGEIANSPDPLTTTQEIEQATQVIKDMGIPSVDTLAYPYGGYNQNVKDILKSKGYIAGRTVDPGYNLRNSDPYALKMQQVIATTTTPADYFAKVIKPRLDVTIANKLWLVLEFHGVEPYDVNAPYHNPYSTTPETLQMVVDYLKLHNVTVVTTHTGACALIANENNPACATPQETAAPSVITIDTTELLPYTVGQSYEETISAHSSRSFEHLTWKIVSGNLPDGLSLNTSTGIITGTTTFVGVSYFTVEISNIDRSTVVTCEYELASAFVDPDKANQAIVFGAIPDKILGDPDFLVIATSTSHLPIRYTATGGCSVSGNSVHLLNEGDCSITAHQDGNTYYNAAPVVTRTFNISEDGSTCPVLCELIENGDFEYPIVNNYPHSFQKFPFDTEGLGWLSTDSHPDGFELVSSLFSGAWSAYTGNQYTEIELGPTHTIYQDLQTIPGGTYTVTFWTSGHPDTQPEQNNATVYINGEVIEHLSAIPSDDTVWVKHSYTFTATSSPTRISFVDDLDSHGDNREGLFLDNVSVRCLSIPLINHAPVITLIGANPAIVNVGEAYIDPGATAFDDEDGDITSAIVATSTVNTSVIGTYTVTYNVTDSDGEKAHPVVRKVNVVSTHTGGPITGKIKACIVFANNQNIIATSSAGLPAGTFSLKLASSTTFSSSTIATKTWSAGSFSPNTRITSSINDADCVTYDNLSLGTYYYSELGVNGSLWNAPKYNDGETQSVNNIFDLFPYSIASTTSFNMNSDGSISLNENRRERTLVLLATYNNATTTNPGGGGGGGSLPSANLGVVKTVDKTSAVVGDTVTYTITISNAGPDLATNVSLTDILSTNLEFLSATSTLGVYSTTTSVWTIGNLANGSSTVLTLIVKIKPGTEGQKITNSAVVTGSQNDPVPQNNTSTVDIMVTIPSTGGGGGGSGGGGGGGNGPITGSYGGGGGSSWGGNGPIVSNGGNATSCYYLHDWLKRGWNNNPNEVKKLQVFLRDLEGFTGLPVNGIYDETTIQAVDVFQLRYKDDVLTPWGHTDSTDFTYILTKKKVNEIYCKFAFPVTPQEQIEIDTYRAFLLALKKESLSTPSKSSNDTYIDTGKDPFMKIEDLIKDGTGTSTGKDVVGKTGPENKKATSRLMANVVSIGGTLVDFIKKLITKPLILFWKW